MSNYKIHAHFSLGSDESLRRDRKNYFGSKSVELSFSKFSPENIKEICKDGKLFTITMQGTVSCREVVIYYLRELYRKIPAVLSFEPHVKYSGLSVECLDNPGADYVKEAVETLSDIFPVDTIYEKDGHLFISVSYPSERGVYSLSLLFWIFRNKNILHSLSKFIADNGEQVKSEDYNESLVSFLCKGFIENSYWSDMSNPGFYLSMFTYGVLNSWTFTSDADGPATAAAKAGLQQVAGYLTYFWIPELGDKTITIDSNKVYARLVNKFLDTLREENSDGK